jgi:3-isopropylmalate dehydrogenase
LLENMMGDILTDQGGGILGSLGLMPSACIGPKKSYYEPAHGSAPGIAGEGVANPFSMIGSAAYMLEKSFGMLKESEEIWDALLAVFKMGYRTSELRTKATPMHKVVSTKQFGDLVAHQIRTEAADKIRLRTAESVPGRQKLRSGASLG